MDSKSNIRTLSDVKMILSHVNIVHYSPVNIDETDDSSQMELNPALTEQRSKNREMK